MISRIWTIGHSTRTIDIFISLLEENGIKLLADVRRLPGSKRYPQFNKEMLAKSLTEHGIRYEHFPELGGRRKAKKDSHNTAWRNASFRGYADHMETEEFRAGVERLLDLGNKMGPTAIMCAEAVWPRKLSGSRADFRSLENTRCRGCAHCRRKQDRAASVHIRSAHRRRHVKLHEQQRSFDLARIEAVGARPWLTPAGFAPCAMCDVSRHRRRELLAFHHLLSQPVKPLGARLSI